MIEFLQNYLHKVVVCPPCPGRVGNLCMGFCGGRKTSETIEDSRVMDENLRSKDENSRSRVENKNTLLHKYDTNFRPNQKGTKSSYPSAILLPSFEQMEQVRKLLLHLLFSPYSISNKFLFFKLSIALSFTK